MKNVFILFSCFEDYVNKFSSYSEWISNNLNSNIFFIQTNYKNGFNKTLFKVRDHEGYVGKDDHDVSYKIHSKL